LSIITGPDSLTQAVTQLIAAMTTPLSQAVAPLNIPTQKDLSPELMARLSIKPGTITWRGRVENETQWQKLTELTTVGYDPLFNNAISNFLTRLESEPVTIDLDIPPRPLPEALPAGLRYLQAYLQVHGLIMADEARLLQALYVGSPMDQTAIAELYHASLQKTLRDRFLQIRTRRGSAAPSPVKIITVRPLTETSGGDDA
jgi:hypothetical protein